MSISTTMPGAIRSIIPCTTRTTSTPVSELVSMRLIPVWSTQALGLPERALQAPVEEWPRLVADPARAPLEDVVVGPAVVDVVAEGAAEVEEAVVAAAAAVVDVVVVEERRAPRSYPTLDRDKFSILLDRC